MSKTYRKYTIHDPLLGEKHYAYEEPCCTVCKHCTDVFWDYSHGPYMALCEICQGETGDTCGKYEPDPDCPPVDVNAPGWHRKERREHEETPEHRL